jgi:brefeldin A-inhibited guanine nucleotide-exchange protein
LELPGGEDVYNEGSAAARLRELLELDVAHAPKSLEKRRAMRSNKVPDTDEASTASSLDKASDGPASSSDMAGKIVGTFEKKQSTQQNFELGSVKFTLSLKSGIQYFVENGFVELDARSVACFFLENKEKLDKTQMGEGLGKEPDAKFLKEEGLDPEKGGPGFWVRVLHHYVDALDFTGLEFDDAIRLFLSGFRLPGEAQKIDRIMEKFAERYTRQNLDVFPSADTAFILAFSVIMLNTDLHNPSIKPEKRMTVDSFIRNNRGISVDGTDLPEDFLTAIFKRIQAQPFSLKEDDDARERLTKGVIESSYLFEGASFFGTSAEERKKANFRKEREEMMSATEHLFKKRPGMTKAEKESKAAAVQITDNIAPADVVKPMFDVTWGPLIGTLSQVLECSTDERSIAVCLNGFAYAIRIAANSHMSLARDTFINSLAKFTYLGSIKEMKHKNIESIKTLMSIAIFDGEHLCESWGPVLQCISQLARLRLVASSLDTDESFIEEKEKLQSQLEDELVYGAGFFRQPSAAEINKETEESNGRAILDAVSEVLIDKVFLSTVKLSAMGIAHFIEQLIAVSASEITGQSKRGITGVGTSSSRHGSDASLTSKKKASVQKEDESPRIFSLQRLVEVADYNMDVRPRLIWAQMWELMATHFAKIGCHDNAFVSTFAIDSLRQLSFKFLEKPELSEFNFQRIFLRPFLEIMSNDGTREDIRELILRCLDNMVRSMSHNLRSGWKVIFSVLAISADDPSERINTLGLAILQRLLDEHLHQLCRLTDGDGYIEGEESESKGDLSALERRNRNANVEDFVGLCRASLAFVQTNESVTPIPIGLSMRALCHTACYADLLADHRVLPPVSGCQSIDPHAPGYTYDGLSESEALEMALWRPLLDGLAEGVRSSLPSHAGGMGCLVQRGSVLALRAIFLRHGHSFSTTQWGVILKETLLPCIQDAAETDTTPVTRIASESPSVSSLEFVVESQPLPPTEDDKGLKKFAKLAGDEESAPKRPLGKAELLVEASFADMRHCGDGNLSQAYKLVQKNVKAGVSEQPFPDSWIATTSGIALGMITDIVTEILLERGAESREVIWPLLSQQLQIWIIGHSSHATMDKSAVSNGNSPALASSWQPCESLIRVACRELHRFSQRLLKAMPALGKDEIAAWSTLFAKDMASTLSSVVVIETGITEELLRLKLESIGISRDDEEEEEPIDKAEEGESTMNTIVETPFGAGKIIEQRTDTYSNGGGGSIAVTTDVVQLASGATLYRPSSPGSMKFQEARAAENGVSANGTHKEARESLWEQFIPALKVQCVAAYCLQLSLSDQLDWLVPLLDLAVLEPLLDALDQSRSMSLKASLDQDLSLAFQEAMFSEWGDGVEEVEEALQVGRSSNQSSSATFFLTQEAGATNNSIHILSLLYRSTGDKSVKREAFAEPILLERTMHVLNRFVESETSEGHIIDPNVWRNASKSGEKIAIFCTSFAFVVVNILNVMLSMTQEQFTRHRQHFYPALCLLVRVQSDEIRQLVSQVLQEKIAPLLNVSIMNEA